MMIPHSVDSTGHQHAWTEGQCRILAVDVYYDVDRAIVAGIVFDDWADQASRASCISSVEKVSDYVPGQFYRRELPCILQLIEEHNLMPEYILVDGYVYLDGHSVPGLGRHLFDALQGKVKVIGVAKKPFGSIAKEYRVFRGGSRKPLYVTCAGEQLSVARRLVASMSGSHRYPDLLKQVDRLSRQTT